MNTSRSQNPGTTWRRVTKAEVCPVCGKPDFCGVAFDGSACICMRVEAGSAKRTRNGGFLHRLNGERSGLSRVRAITLLDRTPSRYDLPILMAKYRTGISPFRLDHLAKELGVSVFSLNLLGVGWAFDHKAWAFPMTDPTGKVLGIRLRLPNGRKLAVRGGREGLFLPADLPHGGNLLIAEGPTDCAALLDLRLAAVGRPCCTGGVRLLVELVRSLRPAGVVIVADGDEAGQRGAVALGAVLVPYVPRLRIMTPPAGIKDARAWKQAGATAADLRAAIDAAPICRLNLTGRKAQGAAHE